MKLDYYILWVEDETSWFSTTSELFEDTVKEHGFNPIIERKKTFDEVIGELEQNGLKKYDIFLIDFNLRNSKNGDSIIDFLRDKNIYTDIIFYSSDKQSIIDSIKEHLFEGVYHSGRKEIENKFERVFLTTIKKVEEISSMRGLIVSETSVLDSFIEDHLLRCLKEGMVSKFNINDFVSKQIFEKIEAKGPFLRNEYEKGGLAAIFPHIDSIKKWELLRGILKKNKELHDYISAFLEVNTPYQTEVIEIRNKFAHAIVIVDDNGKESLKAHTGNGDEEFDENSFRKIRSNLKKHRDSLSELGKCF